MEQNLKEKKHKYKDIKEMLEKNRFLVSIETVKIKDFIFNTNKLKLIRGASYLLDYMNQVEIPKILQKYNFIYESKKIFDELEELETELKKLEKELKKNKNFEKESGFSEKLNSIIKNNIDTRIIYIGAGNAKFFVENEKMAKEICEEIKSVYEKMAPSVKIVAEYEKIGENEKVWDVIDRLAQKTAMKKSEGFPILNIDLPFMKKCDLSGNEPAVIFSKKYKQDLEKIGIHETGYEDGTDMEIEIQRQEQKNRTEEEINNVFCNSEGKVKNISEATAVKIKYSNKMIKNDVHKIGFYSMIKKEIEDIELQGEISDYSTGNSFIGFMYSDGDGLGDFLKNCKERYKNQEDYLRFFRRFSIALDRNTKLSLKEVLSEIKNYRKSKNNKKIVGEFLIVGGDDVCAVFPADLALEISAKFQERFEKKMKEFARSEKDEYNNITSSGGVVIAKDKTPIYQLFAQGIKLQKLAKMERYEKNKEKRKLSEDFYKTGYTDFQNIGGEGLVNIKQYREKLHGKEEKKSLSRRPYHIEGKVDKTLIKLVEKIKELKNQDFPKTKLRYIYELKRNNNLTSNEKIMEAINILSKMNEKEVKVLNEQWNIIEKLRISMEKNINKIDEVFDDIFDVLEMYDFVRNGD
jgi:hypothetical protein